MNGGLTFDRLSKHGLEKLRAEYGGVSEVYKGFSLSYWAFGRQPMTQSLSKMEAEEPGAVQMYQIILTYAGLGQNGTYPLCCALNLIIF